MKKFIFCCELHKEYQGENYEHWNIYITIVAETKEKALEILENKAKKVHYYSSKIEVVELNDENKIEEAKKEQEKSIDAIYKTDKKALALLVGLFGAELGKAQIRQYGVKKGFENTSETIRNVLANDDFSYIMNS